MRHYFPAKTANPGGLFILGINTVRKGLIILWLIFPCLPLFSQTSTAFKDQRDINKSIDSLQQLLLSAKEDSNKVNQLYELGLQLNILNRNEELKKFGEEALSLSRKINYKKGIGISQYLIGLYYYHQADYSRSLKEALTASDILEAAVDKKNLIRCAFLIANIFFYQGQYPESISYARKALKIIEETKDRAEEPLIYNNLGRSYCAIGDLSQGLEYYYKALRSSEKLGDKKGMANSFQFIGAIFYDQNDDSLALINTFTALKLNLETGNKLGYAQNNNSIADIYLRQGKYSEALMMFRESLKIYEEPGAPSWGVPWSIASIGGAIEYLGDSSMEKGNKKAAQAFYQEALNYYLIALEKYREVGIMGGYAEQHFYTGTINIKLNRIPDAKKHLQKGLQISAETGSKELIAKSYLYLSKIDSLEGNYEKAFAHFKLSTLYRDSIFNSEESKKIALYKTQYEIEKKEEEIKLLAAENKLKTTVAEKQKQQKVLAYTMAAMIVLVGSYGFYRYRQRKKMELDKEKIKDRLRISQGLHDDIGSTLSSISVYTLVAQKLSEKNNKDELTDMLDKINSTSSEMVSEMNDIVWSINPKNDSMEKIIQRMESYARPMLMTRNILLALTYNESILTANLEMEKRKNFYLVFKEAVNNAFKYAGCSEMTVTISITNSLLLMTIKDNGAGFDPEMQMKGTNLTLTGNGLRNMKMRAEQMKGELQIASTLGQGTEIRLWFPIS